LASLLLNWEYDSSERGNLLENQNEFTNGNVPEDTVPLEHSIIGKFDLDSEELEASQTILKSNRSLQHFRQVQHLIPL
jgi:hypothetical protein